MAPFRALRLHQTDTAAPDIRIEQLTADDLSIGNVLIANEFSSLNYKDALAVTGKGKIIRDFPMIPALTLQVLFWNRLIQIFTRGST
mgnify:CR=1 FL=1